MDPSGLEEDGPTRAFNREEVGHAVPAEMRGRILQDIDLAGKAADRAYLIVANSPRSQLESALAPVLDTFQVYNNVCSYETIAPLEKAYIVLATPFATMFGARDIDDALNVDASVDGHRQSAFERSLKFTSAVATFGGMAFGGMGIGGAGRGVASGSVLRDPNTIRFSQDSIKNTFSDGRTISELVDGLKSGKIKPGDLPAIRLVEREGHLITIDNRRLEACRRAGVEINTRMATQAEIEQAIRQGKFSGGLLGSPTIRVRGG